MENVGSFDKVFWLLDLFKECIVVTTERAHRLLGHGQAPNELFVLEDARTAGYVATGIAAESKNPVIVLNCGDNESRSLAPAITEAYYRGLPLIVLTICMDHVLDHDNGFKDGSDKSVNLNDLYDTFLHNHSRPSFDRYPVNIVCDISNVERESFSTASILSGDCYRVIQQVISLFAESYFLGISRESCSLIAHFGDVDLSKMVVTNSGVYGLDGCVSFLLGASLGGKHEKYALILTERELMHDINAIGNRDYPKDVVLYVIETDGHSKNLVRDFASSFGIGFAECHSLPTLADNGIIWVRA